MITTKHGETVDFENQFITFDGQEYSIRDLMILKDLYMQFITAEFIMENYDAYPEKVSWDMAGITREKMDKYDMPENEAIDAAIKEYFENKIAVITEGEGVYIYDSVEDLKKEYYSDSIDMNVPSNDAEIKKIIVKGKELSGAENFADVLENLKIDRFKKVIATDEEIAALVEAGEWNIDEEAFKVFQTAEDSYDVDFLCTVHYGNHSFDFVGREMLNDEFTVDFEQYVPILEVDASHHYRTEGQLDKKEFHFDFDSDSLSLPCYLTQTEIFPFTRTKENSSSLEELKKGIVQKLLGAKMIALKPDEYTFMKDNGLCYRQQFMKQRDEYLSKLAHEDKLSPDDLINLSRFYFNNNYRVNDISGSVEKIVDKMDQAGFPETKKNIMFDSMAKLIDNPVNREVFRNTIKMYSGLKKKAEAKASAHTKERV